MHPTGFIPRRRTGLLLVILAALAAYHPAMWGGFLWDDGMYVTANPLLADWEGLSRIWLEPKASPNYYPLTFTSYWIEAHLWRTVPFGYHLTNVLLHCCNTGALFLFLRRLKVPGALLASGLFALHPVHVESVAWIAERKNVLSTLFVFLAFHEWKRWIRTGERRFYFHVAACILAAILSKTVACTLPAVLLLFSWWREPERWKQRILPTIPLFLVGALFAGMTIWWERERMGAGIAGADLSFPDRLIVAGTAPWFYVGKLLWPADLMAIYPRWDPNPANLVHWLAPLATLAVVALAWFLRGRIGRGVFFALGAFLITLSPALGLVDYSTMDLSLVADHYQYPASAGLLALFAALIANGVRRLGLSTSTTPGQIPGAALACLLGILSFQQAKVYTDSETLWKHNREGNPTCWAVHNNLGAALSAKAESLLEEAAKLEQFGRPEGASETRQLATRSFEEAIPAYEEAHRLKPDFDLIVLNIGKAYQNLGRIEEASATYRRALEINPQSSQAYFKLGRLYLDVLKQVDDAERFFLKAVELDPRGVEALNSLGVLEARRNRWDLAAAYFQAVLDIDPRHPFARRNLLNAAIDYHNANARAEQRSEGEPPPVVGESAGAGE